MIVRYIFAFALSLVVLVAWSVWFAPRQQVPPRDGAKQEAGGAGQLAGREDPGAAPAVKRAPELVAVESAPGSQKAPVAAPAAEGAGAGGQPLALTWSEDARHLETLDVVGYPPPQALRSAVLPDGGSSPLLGRVAGSAGTLGLSIRLAPDGVDVVSVAWDPGELGNWKPLPSGAPDGSQGAVEKPLEDAAAGKETSWSHQTEAQGLRITRTVAIAGRSEVPKRASGRIARHLKVKLSFTNLSGAPLSFQYRVGGPSGVLSDLARNGAEDVHLVWGSRDASGKVVVPGPRAVTALGGAAWSEEESGDARPVWVGAFNGRFLAALYGVATEKGADRRKRAALASASRVLDADKRELASVSTALESAVLKLDAAEGSVIEHEYALYAGPRDFESLDGYAPFNLAAANELSVDLSPRFRFRVDSGAGFVREASLLEFRQTAAKDSPVYRLIHDVGRDVGKDLGLLSLELVEETIRDRVREDEQRALWRLPWASWVSEGEGGAPELVLEKVASGLQVTKKVRRALPGDRTNPSSAAAQESLAGPQGSQHLTVTVSVKNLSAQPSEFSYFLHGPLAVVTEDPRSPGSDIEFVSGEWSPYGKVNAQVQSAAKIERWVSQGPAWVALSNSYFTSVLFPTPEPRAPGDVGPPRFFVENGGAEVLHWPTDKEANVRSRLSTRRLDEPLAPGDELTHVYGLFLGPRESQLLASYEDLGLAGINDYGFFVRIFIPLLGTLKSVGFGSWGLGIVLLTILVKLCLHPLNRRTQQSMMRFQKKFQVIQPQMKELQARFGKDRMRYSQEVQKLWREHHVNPAHQMAGCLVLFLQLPIWFGLYSTLRYAIGLRQASFLWIEDLTQPDRLFPIGITLPLLITNFSLDFFNLLPILYVALTVINQRLQPRPQDPQMLAQYRMMSFMLVFLGFIFYHFPAGFMLYIMTSAALGIGESKYIKWRLAKEDGAPGTSGAAGSPTPAVEAAYPSRVRSDGAPPPSRSFQGGQPRSRRRGRR